MYLRKSAYRGSSSFIVHFYHLPSYPSVLKSHSSNMRFTFAILTLFWAVSALAGDEDIPRFSSSQILPGCVTQCFQTAALGGCAQDDVSCLCQSDAFISSITSCVQSSCNAQDQQEAEIIGQAFCGLTGVTGTVGSSTPTPTA